MWFFNRQKYQPLTIIVRCLQIHKLIAPHCSLLDCLEHLGVALLCTDMQRCPSPAVCGVHLGTKVHQVLHNEVLIGSDSHLKGTL